jgi:peptide deformylase
MQDPVIVGYPDPRLAAPAAVVDDFGPALAEAAALLGRAIETAPAVGLSGPHVGLMLRLVAVRLAGEREIRFYVNPVVISASAETERHEEGSVSLPGVVAEVERPRAVRVAFADLEGRPSVEAFDGFAAAVLQHEIDQLDGIFFLDRLSKLRRDRLLKRVKKRAG